MPPDRAVHIAPDFILPSHRGERVRLYDVLARRAAVVLIFYRGHWCPYCRRYLAKLQANHARLLDRSAELIAASPEPVTTSARLAADLKIGFPLLSDIDGTVIDRFGARNRLTAARTILAHPAVVVIDATGAIRFRSVDRDYKRRTTMHAIFRAVDDFVEKTSGGAVGRVGVEPTSKAL